MFYSQLLLSKKGALGIVWTAAHCLKRLKKEQVQLTNISSSVDKIIDDEVNVVTHRILAFLLLGVVRIYSKKVEYLFEDCHEVLGKLSGLKTAKSKQAGSGVGVSKTCYYSITLPKRFELDTFDLELLEDQDLVDGNVRSREQIMLADERGNATSTSGLLRKEKMQFSEAHPTAYTPPRDVLQSHHINEDMFVGSSSNRNIFSSGLETLCEASFSLEDRLDPIVLDEAEKVQMNGKLPIEDMPANSQEPTNVVSQSNNKSDSAPSLETLRGTAFSLEDRLDPMVLDEAEKVQMNGKLPIEDMPTNSQETTNVVSQSNNKSDSAPSLETLRGTAFSLEDHLDPMVFDEVEKEQLSDNDQSSNDNMGSKFCGAIQDGEFGSVANPSPRGSDLEASLGALHECSLPFQHSPGGLKLSNEPSDKECQVEEEHVGSEKFKFPEVATPQSVKCQTPEIPMSVVTKDSKLSEVVAVRTPATKERAKIFKEKRKMLFDSTIMVSNKVFKIWLDDPSDIIRERKDVPNTLLHAWRAHKFGHAPQSFSEPSIPVISEDLADLDRKKINVAVIKESVELSSGQDDVIKPPDVVAHVDCEEIVDMGSPDRSPIAPGTPVTHRTHEAFGAVVAESDLLEPVSSSESVDKWPSSSQVLEPDSEFNKETNSFKGDDQGKGTFSARTRMIGSFLSKKFLDRKKQKKEQILSLSRLLARKTKGESARLFYEILVLKTHDCVELEQENAYGDIFVRETSKLKHASVNLEEN